MRSKAAAGFYQDSLEMLLDTMCNMLGGVIFIALMVALCARDTTAPTPETFAEQTRQLSNDLASVVVSNNVVESNLLAVLQRLQKAPLPSQTVAMHLPTVADKTTKEQWIVILRYGKLYPVFLIGDNGAHLRNTEEVLFQAGTAIVEPRPDQGNVPESGVKKMIQSFRKASSTNFYFVFYVYDDSFDAFTRARATATSLGFQYGWQPEPANERLQLKLQGEHVLPQN